MPGFFFNSIVMFIIVWVVGLVLGVAIWTGLAALILWLLGISLSWPQTIGVGLIIALVLTVAVNIKRS